MLTCIVNHPNQTFTRWEATHYDLRVASLLRYGCHRLTMICASLSLLQIMFAGATRVRCHLKGKAFYCGSAAIGFLTTLHK